MLFALQGWELRNVVPAQPGKSWKIYAPQEKYIDHVWFPKDYSTDDPPILNLYNPANFSLTWRVMNWAWRQHDPMEDLGDPDETIKYWTWRLMTVLCLAGEMEPEPAIKHILDFILRLAFGANMIEICDEVEDLEEE